jgi:hypothetical protein
MGQATFLQFVKIWSDHLAGLLAADDWHDLEGRAGAAPSKYPLLKEAKVVTFHELKTSSEIRFYPAIEVFEPIGQHPAAFAKGLVRGQHVLILETLDDHEKHCRLRCFIQKKCLTP